MVTHTPQPTSPGSKPPWVGTKPEILSGNLFLKSIYVYYHLYMSIKKRKKEQCYCPDNAYMYV